MKYATIRQDGGFELRQSPHMPPTGIALTDEQYDGLAQGSLTIVADEVVTNPNWPPTPNPNNSILAQIAAIKAQMFNSTAVLEAAATNGSNAAKTEVAARVAEIEALRAQLV